MNSRSQVLVVDDDDATRWFLARELCSDCEVVTASGGVEALAACEARRFDLVVTDHTMPGMDGLTWVRNLRRRAGYADIPVIFLTASADPAVTVAAVKSGASRILHKPVSLEEFHAAVKQVLEHPRAGLPTAALRSRPPLA